MIGYVGEARQTAALTVLSHNTHKSPAHRLPVGLHSGLFLLHRRPIVPSVDRQLTEWRSHVVAFIYILILLHFAGSVFVLRRLNCMYGCLFQPLALASVSASATLALTPPPAPSALRSLCTLWLGSLHGKALNWYLLCAGVAIRT